MRRLFAILLSWVSLALPLSAGLIIGPSLNVSNDAADSIQPRIAQGPDGNLHLVWVSGSTSREVRYAKGVWTGSNYAFGASVPVANVGSYGYSTPSLAVAANNMATLCWSDGTTLWARTWRATNASPSGGAVAIGSGISAALATDSSNRFHIVWSGDFDIRYCVWNGTACERSEIIGQNNAVRPYVAVDSSDNVHVTWDGGGGIWYRNRSISGNWNATVQLDTGGNNCQVAADTSGNVHIVWSRDYDIQYLRRSYAVASLERRAFNSDSDLEPTLGITPGGRVLIGFRDATPNKLRYVVLENGIWTTIRDFMEGVGLHITPKCYVERISGASSSGYEILVSTANGETSPETLVPQGSTWRYLTTASDPGTAWRGTNFNHSSWSNGVAQLGFGDGDEATLINGGPSTNRYLCTYFRHAFTLTNAGRWTNLVLSVLRDDGVVVYLNGGEVFRNNMPTGTVNYFTPAVTNVGGTDETTRFYSTSVNSSLLVNGTNVLAAEVHQNNNQSSDLSFDCILSGMLRPVLQVARLSNQLEFAWSSYASNHVLQGSMQLEPGAAWSTISTVVAFSNGTYRATISAPVATRFFRLNRQ